MAPKTPAGRLFCVFYGLFGVPLCLTWINALGKFFGGRAKRLGQFLTKRGMSLVCPNPGCWAEVVGGTLAGDGRVAKIQELDRGVNGKGAVLEALPSWVGLEHCPSPPSPAGEPPPRGGAPLASLVATSPALWVSLLGPPLITITV